MCKPALLLVLLIGVLFAGIAHAGGPNARVVLVDSDRELAHAITTTLAPWKLDVIVDPKPLDTAAARADARSARFVVWREGSELVVFDRERNEAVRRDAPSGSLDPVTAASLALTVKTLMRLPPEPEGIETRPKTTEVIEPAGHTELRVQAGLATRISHDTIGGRFAGAVLVRPLGDLGLRCGVVAEAGGSEAVDQAGFQGTRSDYQLLVVASWTFSHGGHLELEPFIAGGIEHSRLEGSETGTMATMREERDTLTLLRVGASVRWRVGMWSVGVVLGIDGVPSTPTYTKDPGNAVIYEVPAIAVSVGLVVAADLGR